MDHLKQKQKQIEKMMDVLKRSNVSTDTFDSTKQPFFKPDTEKFNFEINHDNDFEVPDGLNRNVKLIYDILGNSKKEIYIGEWTIMTLERAMEQYGHYCKDGQKRVFEIGFRYMGMGHIELVSCDLETHLLFYHRGGGSNGWDREANYKDIIKYTGKEYDQFYFSDWFYKIKLENNHS
jgi:hypothetical protein